MNLVWRENKSAGDLAWELEIDAPGTDDHQLLMAQVWRIEDGLYRIYWWTSVEDADGSHMEFAGPLERAMAYAVALVRMT